MSADRTPTPWKMSGKRVILSEGGGLVFRLALRVTADVHWRNRDANAEFIVRAANSHDELVAALKEAIEELETCSVALNGEGYNNLSFNEALAKAEGRS